MGEESSDADINAIVRYAKRVERNVRERLRLRRKRRSAPYRTRENRRNQARMRVRRRRPSYRQIERAHGWWR